MTKLTMMNKCTSSAGCFDGHSGAPEQYRRHFLMQHVQGYSRRATGCCHRVTTCYVLPQRLLGQQANKQKSTNTPKKVAVLMAMAMRWYATARIAQWRRFRALLEITGCCHRASICRPIGYDVFLMFSSPKP
jgi:hypothetical protein